MSKTTHVKNTRIIDEWRQRVEKGYNSDKKGFKIIRHEKTNCIYSLLTQKKLLEVSKEYPIEMTEKAIILPIEPIRYLLDPEVADFVKNDQIAVVNLKGEIITLARKLKLYKDFFQFTNGEFHDEWGLYDYDGKEILSPCYYSIEGIEINLRGEKHMIFHVISYEGGAHAIYNSKARHIIPWSSKIKLNMRQNKITVITGKHEKLYKFVLDRDGELDIERQY